MIIFLYFEIKTVPKDTERSIFKFLQRFPYFLRNQNIKNHVFGSESPDATNLKNNDHFFDKKKKQCHKTLNVYFQIFAAIPLLDRESKYPKACILK